MHSGRPNSDPELLGIHGGLWSEGQTEQASGLESRSLPKRRLLESSGASSALVIRQWQMCRVGAKGSIDWR